MDTATVHGFLVAQYNTTLTLPAWLIWLIAWACALTIVVHGLALWQKVALFFAALNVIRSARSRIKKL